MMKFPLFIYFLFVFNLHHVSGQSEIIDSYEAEIWVNSQFDSMSITERMDQLLVVDAEKSLQNPWDSLFRFGGILMSGFTPSEHVNLANELQEVAQTPMLVFGKANDGYGLQMDSVHQLANAMEIHAISEPHLLYATGQTIAQQCQSIGIHGFFNVFKDVNQELVDVDWRRAEINEGMKSEGLVGFDELKFLQYRDLDIISWLEDDQLEMIVVEPKNVPDFHEAMKMAIGNDPHFLEILNRKCRQLLGLKWKVGLGNYDKIKVKDWKTISLEEKILKYELTKASLTVLKNDQNLLPVKDLKDLKVASLSLEKSFNPVLEKYLNQYTKVDHFQASYYSSDEVFSDLWETLSDYDLIIVGHYPSGFLEDNLDGTESFMIFQEWLNLSDKCVQVYFGDPNVLKIHEKFLGAKSLILSYEDNDLYNALVPQLIFGGIGATGVSPIDLSTEFSIGHGIPISQLGRFSYGPPEEANLDAKKLSKIHEIAIAAIKEKAMPGCQIVVAKDNKVIFQESYGYYTYDSLQKVTDDDLYDLASITKVTGALPALMKLHEEGKFDLDATLGTYLRYFKRGNKKKLTFREILAHQSGQKSGIGYWKTDKKKNGKYRRKTLNTVQSEKYPYEISDGLYVYKDYKKKIYKQIRKSDLGEKKYLYSGLTFYLFPDIIASITGEKYDEYLYNNFYKPLGATTLTHNPLDKFDMDRIVPTEYDSLFRHHLVHGKVHDEGAALMQGMSSNAGLFSSANDLAKLFQMYCNYGSYGGQQYLSEATVQEFARCQFPENDNRRGLGFDRPLPEPHENGNTAKSVSQLSFGHSGFTGTYAWADPEYNIVYIFLSNRVYPTRENTKLYKHNIRTNIQEVIYEAMEE